MPLMTQLSWRNSMQKPRSIHTCLDATTAEMIPSFCLANEPEIFSSILFLDQQSVKLRLAFT